MIKALAKHGFHRTGGTSSHVKMRYEHPSNPNDVRIVVVPLHDPIKIGTLQQIAKQAGANDFQAFCTWIEQAR